MILAQNCIMNAFSEFASFNLSAGANAYLLSSLHSGSPYPSLGLFGGAGSGSPVGSLGPNSNEWSPLTASPQHSPSLPPLAHPSTRNSPSPAHSLTPTPTPGSQTPQPHTPSLPQLATSGSQQQLPSVRQF